MTKFKQLRSRKNKQKRYFLGLYLRWHDFFLWSFSYRPCYIHVISSLLRVYAWSARLLFPLYGGRGYSFVICAKICSILLSLTTCYNLEFGYEDILLHMRNYVSLLRHYLWSISKCSILIFWNLVQ